MFETATVHGTIAVSDLDRARKFYEGMLGFQVKDERSDGVRYEDAAGHYFLIYPSRFAGTDKSTHISFEVSDVEEAAAELRERGVVFEEYDLPGIKTVNGIAEIQGVKGGWFKDPDGNILSLAELTG